MDAKASQMSPNQVQEMSADHVVQTPNKVEEHDPEKIQGAEDIDQGGWRRLSLTHHHDHSMPHARKLSVRAGSLSDEILKHSHDQDEAMKALGDRDINSIEVDEATNKRILRRIDWNLIPIMCVVYGLNFLDKTAIGYASVMGIQKDIGLKGDEYQWLGSIFYFGYLGWEYPTNLLLQRLPLAKYSSFNIIMWGITLTLFAAVSNFAGAVVIRLFLGIFESAVTPGFALFTSQYYTKFEQGLRTGIWFSFNGFAQIFGGLVAYGIAVGVERHPAAIAGWKIVFMVIGLLTTAIGVIFLFTVPDTPLKARFLKEEDRILAVARIKVNQQGIGNKHFKWYQLREALTDPISWCFFFLALFADIPNGGITNFASLLILDLGYNAKQTLIYGTPTGAVEVVTLILCGYFGDKLGSRIIIGCSGLVLSIIGIVMVMALSPAHPYARLGGIYLLGSSATAFVAILSLISSNIAGYTKKTTVAAMYLIGYCTGNIIGPQTFRPQDAPSYVPAKVVMVACWGVCIGIMFLMYFIYRYRNSVKAEIRGCAEYIKVENQGWLDLTDIENPEFVYAL